MSINIRHQYRIQNHFSKPSVQRILPLITKRISRSRHISSDSVIGEQVPHAAGEGDHEVAVQVLVQLMYLRIPLGQGVRMVAARGADCEYILHYVIVGQPTA